jgi:hypothetical protein
MLLALAASPLAASAQSAAFCAPNQSPSFTFGFADLKSALGYIMGDPIECEHPNSANGDTLQQTTTGLAVYRSATNSPEFTDGWNHWALAPQGVIAWSGADTPESPGAQPVQIGAPAAATGAASTPRAVPAPPAATQCVEIGGGTCLNAANDLADTVQLLASSKTANLLLARAAQAGYDLRYGNLPTDVLGLFRPASRDVIVSNDLREFPSVDRGPVIAHELQHVSDWLAEGARVATPEGCIATEANAFHTESAVWLELRGGQLGPASNALERELNTITRAITTDPEGFASRLTSVYQDECKAEG